ncbi:TlpA disulfide reductase family protein [Flavivirga abyssicola]|uniref:TlpA family protein disulfide reductase n=1 Tax=Flavivirga abyssicola TaxID=3063533 RepID=UPI0026E01F1B|nr:TlpA disulfide reductase family protein [Flavivirga sp. MEBiC07777]WVK12012.1 TlpA disulfide reductase family protein [Flavivirga sp. MEBiC07777]
MKKATSIIALILLIVSCKKEQQIDYVTLSGIVENPIMDSLIVVRTQGNSKFITLDEDGTFLDTLKVKEGFYDIYKGDRSFRTYLKNGYDLKINLKNKIAAFDITFDGKGAKHNNFIEEVSLKIESVDYDELMALEQPEYEKKSNAIIEELRVLLKKTDIKDSLFLADQEKIFQEHQKFFDYQYKKREQNLAKNKFKETVEALEGKASPKFEDYKNHDSSTTSLDDLKGKYVYIDFWATWCLPCIGEFPSLKRIEKAYHNKNIEFVSISIDKKKDYNKWYNMVKEKKLTGIKLFSNEDKLLTDYFLIRSIPRFILLDPNGIVIKADAPRPSDPKLPKLLNKLDL